MEEGSLLSLRLTAIRYAGRDTNLYTFAKPDSSPLPPAKAGAHISLELGNGLSRQYSLVHAGSELREYLIGVKRAPDSRGGSAFIHDKLRVGDIVQIAPPLNNFPLDENAEHSVMFAGGIGTTPICCMAERLSQLGRRARVYAAFKDREECLLTEPLERFADTTFHFDDEDGGFLPIAELIAASPKDAHLYCCGPLPMMEAFLAAANAGGRPAEQLHVEYFEATQQRATAGGFAVVLARTGVTLEVQPGSTILDVVRNAGVNVSARCQEGICGACETAVIDGVPDHRDSILSPKERASNKTMMICCSGALSDKLVLDL